MYFADMRILILDNTDSFTHNLAQLFASMALTVVVRRNTTSMRELAALQPDALCISPGPKTPSDTGVCYEALQYWETRLPVLGVCLGMQLINEFYDGRTVHAPQPVHGKTDLIHHDGTGLLRDIPSPFEAARYHSLMIRRHSDALIEHAHTVDGTPMALRHRELNIHGVQFHPESFLTMHGETLARNFVAMIAKAK